MPTNGEEITRYEVITAPPLDGAVHETVAEESPDLPTTPVGASGTVEGTIGDEPVEAEPVPDTFVAVTVNVYEVPLERPVTVQLVELVEHVNEPGVEVTVYPVIAAPPVLTGAVHDTTDSPFAAPVALTAVGAPGTVEGVAAADADEDAPVPDSFVAVTVNV